MIFSQINKARLALALYTISTATSIVALPYQSAGESYLKSFGVVESTTPKKETRNSESEDIDLSVKILTPQEKRQLTFSILTNLDGQQADTTAMPTLLQDLNVLCGQTQNPEQHLVGRLDNTVTVFGQAALAKMATSPLTDVTKIQARQALIKELMNNKTLFNDVQELLEDVNDAESTFLSFWTEEEPALKEFFDKLYFNGVFSFMNKSSLALETWTRLGNLNTTITVTYPLLFLTLSNYYQPILIRKLLPEDAPADLVQNINKNLPVVSFTDAIKQTLNIINPYTYLNTIDKSDKEIDIFFETNKNPFVNQSEINDQIIMAKKITRIITGVQAAGVYGLVAWHGYQSKKEIDKALENKNAINNLQERLIGASTFVTSVEKINTLAAQHAVLAHGLTTRELATELRYSDEFKNLIDMLQCNTFKGDASFFSLSGRVLAANKIIRDCKNEFAGAMAVLGELDACMSIAKLMKKFEHERVNYCFVEFIDLETPYINLEDFWNPFVNSAVVVANSLELGGTEGHNVILTGANTGGKSTILKGMMISMLLAHTFGIAPAAHATMTSFGYMGTSLNISDNTAAGDSLFKAEVNRAQAFITAVESLGTTFGFLIIDELFTGTDAKKGAAAGEKVALHLNKFNNLIFILATHFPELTSLEEATNGNCKNFKIEIYKDEEGNLIRPFKIEPGVNSSNVADDILKQELDTINFGDTQQQ